MKETKTLITLNKTELPYRVFEKENSSKIALVCHGIMEHSGRYKNLAQALTEIGYKLYAFDLPGHGLNNKKPFHIDTFQIFIETMSDIIDFIYNKENKKIVLIGHSMGGLITLHYLNQNKEHHKKLSHIILSSPAIKTPFHSLMLFFANILSKIIPRVCISSSISDNKLSRDKNEVLIRRNDYLVLKKAPVLLMAELLKYMSIIQNTKIIPEIPMLCLIAGNDFIVDGKYSKNYFEKNFNPLMQINFYKEYYHELFHDIKKEAVFKDLQNWLNENKN